MSKVEMTDTNVKEKVATDEAVVAEEEPVSMGTYIKETIISSLNVRFNDFSNPLALAGTVGFFMIGGFVALVCVNMLLCPEATNITTTVDYNTGVTDMQKKKVNSILSPDNLAEIEAAGITRTAEICLRRGGVYVTEDINAAYPSTWNPAQAGDGTTNKMLVLQQCSLGTDEVLAAAGFDVKWCPGYYDIEVNDYTDNTFLCDQQDIPGVNLNNVYIVEFMSTVTEVQRTCPSFQTALGSALAYIGYLELFFTAVMGFILIQLGICKPNSERATISNLLKAAENDTQEIEDAIEQLRADVDAMKASKE